jgi:histidinol-phosphate/aromatic aminotransferase/cobyric acid decarboxylase-like protein
MPFYNAPALAQASRVANVPPDAVMINANENPLGPCAEARDAACNIVAKGGRYLYGETDKVAKILAEQEGIKYSAEDRDQTYIRIYPGSSAPLHQTVLAFTSPTKPLVMGDPGYEAGSRAAEFIGAKVIRVPLKKDFSHDVKAMVAASSETGLFYICNPNNPTGTLTKRSDIEWLVENKPRGSVVMIDEAYTHIAGDDYFSTNLVQKDRDVIILRTFSKIYGMAGMRAGAALGRPDLLEKMGGWGAGMMPITGMVAASTSLQVKSLIPERRKIIGGVREDTLSFLTAKGFTVVPSVSNKFMVDTKRPGNDVVMAMRKEKVYIGRVWPIWPTYVRVSVGTKEEMEKFKTAFVKVMA